MFGTKTYTIGAVFLTAVALPAGIVNSESLITARTNSYGMPGGLIDMPTAEMAPDAQLGLTISRALNTTRTTLTFQIAPRLSAAFRYSSIDGLIVPDYDKSAYFDRSFDLRYQLVTETDRRPGLAIGLRDFIGTGLYSSEYLVATKSFGPKLRFSGGVGWGRLGSYESFASTGSRPETLLGQGGVPTYDRWFRGPVAAFAGVSYAPTKKLSFKVEYSSDAYAQEVGDGLFERRSPINIGVDYRLSKSIDFSGYYMHGSELGAKFTIAVNPRVASVPGGREEAPRPVAVRPAGSAADLGWTVEPENRTNIRAAVAKGMAAEGLVLDGLRLDGTSAEVLVRNPRYDMTAQAVGRTARVLTRTLPASVETFRIVQTLHGTPTGSVTLRRSDVERYENSAARVIYDAASFGDGGAPWARRELTPGSYPRLTWGLAPYATIGVFDPDDPARINVGLRLKGDYELAPGIIASASITQRLTDNPPSEANPRPVPPGVTPPPVVRSDLAEYERSGGPKIEHLTLAHYGRPGPNLYSRLTGGILEPMYAGVSGEVLWKRPESRLALGAELNYVQKRGYDQRFDLQDYTVVTGHASAYYDIGNGFHGQVDVGRYLAGDWGATVAIDREFANGWRVGAYATKTNLSADEFGEGSFDKGIRFTFPMSWGIGSPTKASSSTVLQSLTRDGGAKLKVNGRLYDNVRATHPSEMAKSWEKFWR